jgi:hypothetical protein
MQTIHFCGTNKGKEKEGDMKTQETVDEAKLRKTKYSLGFLAIYIAFSWRSKLIKCIYKGGNNQLHRETHTDHARLG